MARAAAARPLIRLRRVASGFTTPLYVATAPGEHDRIYVVSQGGLIDVVKNGTRVQRPFLDIEDDVDYTNENGLLSLAFHPEYPADPRIYVVYNDLDWDLHLVEYRVEQGRVRQATARDLMFVDKEEGVSWHNGGQLTFGPDGMLYVAFGDSAHTPLDRPPAPKTDPENHAQDLSLPFGKLFRLDVDAPKPSPELLAYGLRNPWRFSFDSETSDLYIADVGFHRWEEVDVIHAGERHVLNFGWSSCEGPARFKEIDACYQDCRPNPLNRFGRLAAPLLAYRHGSIQYCGGGNGSIIGGYVYRGRAIPTLRGRYLFGDFCSGNIWSMRVRRRAVGDIRREQIKVPGLTSFGEDAHSELYAVAGSGDIYRLAAR